MTREPLVTAASILAIVTAGIALFVAFGVDLSKDEQAAILGFVAVVAPLAVAAFTRSKVTPVADPRL